MKKEKNKTERKKAEKEFQIKEYKSFF